MQTFIENHLPSLSGGQRRNVKKVNKTTNLVRFANVSAYSADLCKNWFHRWKFSLFNQKIVIYSYQHQKITHPALLPETNSGCWLLPAVSRFVSSSEDGFTSWSSWAGTAKFGSYLSTWCSPPYSPSCRCNIRNHRIPAPDTFFGGSDWRCCSLCCTDFVSHRLFVHQ